MNGPIRKVAIAVFIAFAVLLLDITYIQAIAGPDVAGRRIMRSALRCE